MLMLFACIENEVGAPVPFDSGGAWSPPTVPDTDSDTATGGDSPTPDSDPTTTTWIDTDVDTADTDTTTPEPYVCPELREAPWDDGEELVDMPYAEDFAFESDGSIVLVDLVDLVRVWPDGTQELIFPFIGSSRGILPIDGDCYAISVNDFGEVQRICTDGSRETLVYGVQSLGIALDDRRRLYYDDWISKGIGWVDLDTHDGAIIESGFSRPDGVVWSATDHAVYFVQNDPPRLMRFVEDGDAWLPSELVAQPDGALYFDGITVDACGNIYIADMGAGVYRWNRDTEETELLASFPLYHFTPSAHFGEGYGEWPSDHLYVMDMSGQSLWKFDAEILGQANPEVDG